MKSLKYAFKHEWYSIIMLLLPFLAIPFLYSWFPAQMASHWSISGHPNLFSNKSLVLTLIPTINALLYFIILHQARAQQESALLLRTGVVISLLAVHIWNILLNIGVVHSVIDLMSPLTAFILLLSGNYLRKKIPMDLIGLLPWTLENYKNLQKNRRFIAFVLILGGFLLLASFPFVSEKSRIDIFEIIIIGTAALPIAYSFYLHKLKPSNH